MKQYVTMLCCVLSLSILSCKQDLTAWKNALAERDKIIIDLQTKNAALQAERDKIAAERDAIEEARIALEKTLTVARNKVTDCANRLELHGEIYQPTTPEQPKKATTETSAKPAHGECVLNSGYIIADRKEILDKAIRMKLDGDTAALQALYDAGKIAATPAGLQVFLVKAHLSTNEVRLKGRTEILWTTAEAIECNP